MYRILVLIIATTISLPIFGSEIVIARGAEEGQPVLLAEMKIAEARSWVEDDQVVDNHVSLVFQVTVEVDFQSSVVGSKVEFPTIVSASSGPHSSRAPPTN